MVLWPWNFYQREASLASLLQGFRSQAKTVVEAGFQSPPTCPLYPCYVHSFSCFLLFPVAIFLFVIQIYILWAALMGLVAPLKRRRNGNVFNKQTQSFPKSWTLHSWTTVSDGNQRQPTLSEECYEKGLCQDHPLTLLRFILPYIIVCFNYGSLQVIHLRTPQWVTRLPVAIFPLYKAFWSVHHMYIKRLQLFILEVCHWEFFSLFQAVTIATLYPVKRKNTQLSLATINSCPEISSYVDVVKKMLTFQNAFLLLLLLVLVWLYSFLKAEIRIFANTGR